MRRRGRIFYGWWMVAAAMVLNALAGGTFVYGFTVFFNPIRNTFGWGAAVTAVAFTLQRFESGLLEVVAGFLVDKVGPRRLMVMGWTLVGAGFVLMSQIQSLLAFYGAFLLMATGLSFAVFIVLFAPIANWFVRKRSRAMTLITVGFGASGGLVPLLAAGVDNLGWRETLLGVGIVLWAIGIPLSLLMRHRPDRYGYLPDGDSEPWGVRQPVGSRTDTPPSGVGFAPREAMRTRAFWLLASASLFQFMGASAVMVHIMPYLESVDMPRTTAAIVVTGITLCSLIGRLGFGLMGDFANKRVLIAIGSALQITGVFILSFVDASRMWVLIPFLLTYAPGFGSTIPLRPALQADYFGTRNYGTIMGLMMLVSMAGGLASPVVAGWLFDTMGTYHVAFRLIALASIPAVPLMLLATPPSAMPAAAGATAAVPRPTDFVS